jgi:hypothetical protein
MQVDPWFYTWSGRYGELELDLQIAGLVKCFRDFNIPGVDREKLAYEKWLKAEGSCRATNQMFRSRWTGSIKPLSHPVEEVYHLVKRKITEIMGTVKPRDMALLRESCRHGPGGDLSLGRRHASPYEKYRSRGAITEPCQRLYDVVFGQDPDYRQDLAHEALIVLASRLSFVPKTALIDRAICIEPRWNVYLQLGIGGLIERRLRRYGMVLIKDQSRNSEFARRAWADGLATIDLSSASDTVSTNLVLDLLADGDPFWLDLIMASRCAYVEYRGKTIRLEKVSSMGNGYTFPLESAIFYAFAWAAARVSGSSTEDITVYGDDIIVPRSCSTSSRAVGKISSEAGKSVRSSSRRPSLTSGTPLSSTTSWFSGPPGVYPLGATTMTGLLWLTWLSPRSLGLLDATGQLRLEGSFTDLPHCG